jgi:hypothetical protein
LHEFSFKTSYIAAYSHFEAFREELRKWASTLAVAVQVGPQWAAQFLDPEEESSLRYIRLRRNELVHGAGPSAAELKLLVVRDGARLNQYWQARQIRFMALDFRSSRTLSMTQHELIDLINIMRRMAERLDAAVLRQIDKDRLVQHAVTEFKTEYAVMLATMPRKKREGLFAFYIDGRYSIKKKDVDFLTVQL